MSVVLPQWRLFFDVFMGFYEGYVIYCFFAVMVLTGGGDAAAIMTFINQGSPFSYYCCGLRLFTFDDAPALYRFMRLSVLQYVFLKPALLLVVAVLDMTGRNGMYIQFVVLCSTMWAFASLIQVRICVRLGQRVSVTFQTSYRLRSTLAAHTTNKKMAVIKVLIVVVALQQLAMNLLFGYDVIHGGDDKKFSAQERADRIYAFVCIVEAFVYSIMLQRTFTHREFRNLSVGDDNGVGRGRCSSMCLDVLELWHVFSGLEELERPIMKDLDVLDEL
jgi:hypothetical protein